MSRQEKREKQRRCDVKITKASEPDFKKPMIEKSEIVWLPEQNFTVTDNKIPIPPGTRFTELQNSTDPDRQYIALSYEGDPIGVTKSKTDYMMFELMKVS